MKKSFLMYAVKMQKSFVRRKYLKPSRNVCFAWVERQVIVCVYLVRLYQIAWTCMVPRNFR